MKGYYIHNTKVHDPDLGKYYKEPSVHCIMCNDDIGRVHGEKCPTCGYSTTESLVYWIMENKKFETYEGIQT